MYSKYISYKLTSCEPGQLVETCSSSEIAESEKRMNSIS